MPYTDLTALAGRMRQVDIVRALDEDGDRAPDAAVWALVYASIERHIHGLLEGAYAVPFADPVPGVVTEAAEVLACEALYMRNGLTGDQNPWTAKADALLDRLEKIGRGEAPLSASLTTEDGGGAAVVEDLKTHSATGAIMV